MAEDTASTWRPFHYTPSTILPIIFLSLFALTTLFHTFQMFKSRTWYLIPLVLGGLSEVEVIGFIARLLSHPNNISILGPYIIQAIFILIAPTLFAASIYIVLGRIILLVDGERYSFIRQKHLTAAFVAGDIISFQLQGNGGGLTAGKSSGSISIGRALIITGLFAQLLFFGLFIYASFSFHHRLVDNKPVRRQIAFRSWKRWFRPYFTPTPTPTTSSNDYLFDREEIPWRRHMYVLYTTSVLILVRSLFRVVEYIQGENGYFLSHEVYLYALDAGLMVGVMVLFNVVHPSQITKLYQERLKGEGDAVGEREVDGVELQRTGTREQLVCGESSGYTEIGRV